jgi:hypothetical protein
MSPNEKMGTQFLPRALSPTETSISLVKGRERMKRWFWSVCAGALLMGGVALAQQPAVMRIKAPELREVTEWINTKPLTLAELQGKVVVLHFWTFG